MPVPSSPVLSSLGAIRAAIVACERCPRLRAWCERVAREKRRQFRDQEYWGRPVPGFGDPRARLLVVGLAPAAHGGNRTGRVFTGDSSGDWLYEALHRFGFASRPASVHRGDGLRLRGCYVTASARCAPPDNRPAPAELDNCRPYLEAEIRLLPRAKVVVVLGRVAHETWLKASGWRTRLAARARPRFAHGGEARLPDGTVLIASYHPSRQNTNTGRLTRAMWHAVFRRARARLRGGVGGARPAPGARRAGGARPAAEARASGRRDRKRGTIRTHP
jgi:uracil-DNA glycosylase family 4